MSADVLIALTRSEAFALLRVHMRRHFLSLAATVALFASQAEAKPKPKAVAAPAKQRPKTVEKAKAKNAAMSPSGTAMDVSPASAPSSSASGGGSSQPSRGPTRLDFDDRLIQGQTNRSGAVYLYDRKELKVRSMIKKRESFRDEILRSVYDG